MRYNQGVSLFENNPGDGEMQINIPEDIYHRLHQVAMKHQQPVEEIVIQRLQNVLDEELARLPSDEQAELRALDYLSDDALFCLAAEQISFKAQERLNDLMTKNSRGQITQEEHQELAAYVERSDRLMLRKAEAFAILHQRGYSGVTKDSTRPRV